jgi:hypothetical protein
MPGGFLNHCHPEQSEGAKRPTAMPRARSRGVSHSRTPSFNVVILSEVRRSVATEREWKDLLSSAPTRLRQGILTAAHQHRQRSPRTHTNVAHT